MPHITITIDGQPVKSFPDTISAIAFLAEEDQTDDVILQELKRGLTNRLQMLTNAIENWSIALTKYRIAVDRNVTDPVFHVRMNGHKTFDGKEATLKTIASLQRDKARVYERLQELLNPSDQLEVA